MVEIRSPLPGEKEQWLPLWQGYLNFYETSLAPEITDLTWLRCHDPQEPMQLLGAYREGKMVGFVTYLFHRSTWARNHYCYLEDIFVSEKVRGQGIGQQLIETVRVRAIESAAERLYWNTREGNVTAQKMYDKLAERTDFIQYRIGTLYKKTFSTP